MKTPIEAEFLISSGRSFQNFGAYTEKALEPAAVRIPFGTSKHFPLSVRRFLPLLRIVNKSWIYFGIPHDRVLYVIKPTLKSILSLIGNQCKDDRKGADGENLGALWTVLYPL